jgi:predicted acetyltransferase
MKIEVHEADEAALDIVGNLVSFYVYDLSELLGWECPESGLYSGCNDLSQYWGMRPADPGHRWPEGWRGFPFIVRVDGRLAGFALIRQLDRKIPPTFEVGEFFVVRKYRGRGVGKGVAHVLFDRFRGNWEVRELLENGPAQTFWRKVIDEYSGGEYSERVEGRRDYYRFPMLVQRFSSAEEG